MSDLAAIVLALATAGGAWAALPLPLLPALAVAAVGVGLRRPALVVVGAALVASALGARAEAGLRPPVLGQWQGTATLVGDPARGAGRRAWWGSTSGSVASGSRPRPGAAPRPGCASRLAGEQVWLSGEVQEVPGSARAFLARRHVAARITVDRRGPVVAGRRAEPAGQRPAPHAGRRAPSRWRPSAGRCTPASCWATTEASPSRSPTTSGPPGCRTCSSCRGRTSPSCWPSCRRCCDGSAWADDWWSASPSCSCSASSPGGSRRCSGPRPWPP